MGYLTISIDGGYKETFDNLYPIIKYYNLPTTWFLVSNYLNKYLEGRLVISIQEIEKLLLFNTEIGCHSHNHFYFILNCKDLIKILHQLKNKDKTKQFKFLTKAIFQQEVVKSKKLLEEIIKREIVSFAYPYGNFNHKLQVLLKKANFVSARTTLDGYNFLENINFYELRTKVIHQQTSLEEMNRWLEEISGKNIWLIETYHLVSKKGSQYFWNINITDFIRHIEYAFRKNIIILNQKDVCQNFKKN